MRRLSAVIAQSSLPTRQSRGIRRSFVDVLVDFVWRGSAAVSPPKVHLDAIWTEWLLAD